MNSAGKGEGLTAETREAIREFVGDIVGRWAKLVGTASVGTLILGLAYFFFALPQQVANSAVATGSLSRTVGAIEDRMNTAQTSLASVEVSLQSLNDATPETLETASAFLTTVAENEQSADIINEMNDRLATLESRIEEAKEAWPAGSYCIVRFEESCPAMFEDAWLHVDLDSSTSSSDRRSGLPDNDPNEKDAYQLSFCCK